MRYDISSLKRSQDEPGLSGLAPAISKMFSSSFDRASSYGCGDFSSRNIALVRTREQKVEV